MRNFFLGLLLFWLTSGSLALAQVGLKTATSVEVNDGYVAETVVVADDSGKVFLEFLKGDRVAKTSDRQRYTGEVLAPIIIDAPAKAPRARMREVLSFELLSDTNEPIEFIDQYAAIHAKKRLRLSLQSQSEGRRQGAQLITLLPQVDSLKRPSLWYYQADNQRQPSSTTNAEQLQDNRTI